MVKMDFEKCSTEEKKEPDFTMFMINHHIMWFDVSMHDAFGVTKIECLVDKD
jgi:hypothetical protein